MVNRDEAETIALQGLAYLASEPDLLNRFMALTGLTPSNIQENTVDPAFLAGVLDFLLGHEPDLLAFCADAGLPPDAPARARRGLPDSEVH